MLFSNRTKESEAERIMGAREQEEYTIKRKKMEKNRFDYTKNIRCL